MTICVPSLSQGNLGHGHRSPPPPQEQIFRDHDHMCSKSFERKSMIESQDYVQQLLAGPDAGIGDEVHVGVGWGGMDHARTQEHTSGAYTQML